jgi:acetyltransferase-like isoleucine patch superfamily enzyme
VISSTFKLLQVFSAKIKRAYEQRQYDNFTIAEYFRKQGARVGANCYIVPRQLGTEPYLVKIGNHVFIANGVEINTHDGGTWLFREEIPDLRVFGPVVIEDNCVIGEHAIIQPNVTIGPGSIVASGSVVITDVPPNSIVMGVPARQFGSVDKYKEKCISRWKVQKPPIFHEDSKKHYWSSPDREIILSQLRDHLTQVFHKELS